MTKPVLEACRCCGGSNTQYLWNGDLIGYSVAYFECSDCGYFQTEHPYWLEEAYSDAIISNDTGIMSRNLANSRITAVTLKLLGSINGCVVDYAGGFGLLVRLLRDLGIDAFWHDPYCENLVARGFEYTCQEAHLVTAFEVFEHFVYPGKELDKLLKISNNILLSTSIIDEEIPDHEKWWYYGKEHGQHIGFYKIQTLQKLATSKGLKFYSNGVDRHLICKKPINKTLWRILMKTSRYVSPLITKSRDSKVWSDYLELSSRHITLKE